MFRVYRRNQEQSVVSCFMYVSVVPRPLLLHDAVQYGYLTTPASKGGIGDKPIALVVVLDNYRKFKVLPECQGKPKQNKLRRKIGSCITRGLVKE